MACALTKATPGRRPSRRGDVSRQGDNQLARKLRGRSPRRLWQSPQRILSLIGLQQVSMTSQIRRGDVSPVADKISLRDVAATDGDVAETSPRPAGDWKNSPKIEHV